MDLVLRSWNEGDRESLIDIGRKVDRTYLSGVPYPFRERDADWYIGYCTKHDGRNGIFRAVVVDGRTVGSISVNQLNSLLSRDAQLGFYILPEYMNRGIMTRALRLMCHMAFQQLDILRISACIISENTASRRVVEKNDFTLEGKLRNCVWKNERPYDLVIYGKLR